VDRVSEISVLDVYMPLHLTPVPLLPFAYVSYIFETFIIVNGGSWNFMPYVSDMMMMMMMILLLSNIMALYILSGQDYYFTAYLSTATITVDIMFKI
jgi:hypothetical protein